MRLIDADAIKYTEYINGDITVSKEEIERQQTAYDTDKVVEKFDAKIKAIRNTKYIENELQNIAIQTIIINVISDLEQIVKQGGVSDDVCEWKIFDNSLTEEPQWVYETTCGKYVGEEHTSKSFVYCPYCSKKIKVVE